MPTNEELLAENQKLKEELAACKQRLATIDAHSHDARRLVSDRIASIAHDLRTPLNAIIGFSELLREEAITEPEEKRSALDDIHVGGQRLLKMINELLDKARADANK